jgi:hypothetical protein
VPLVDFAQGRLRNGTWFSVKSTPEVTGIIWHKTDRDHLAPVR